MGPHPSPEPLDVSGVARAGLIPLPLCGDKNVGSCCPLREGMDLLIYGLRALGWESSQHELCKNTGICFPTVHF